MNNLVRVFLFGAATLAAQTTINTVPSREFGQPKLPPSGSSFTFPSQKENYVEGRELSSPTSIAFDNSVSPPIVYVADTLNNRVLAWKSAASVSVGNFADKVIGQNDLFSTSGGGPTTSLTTGLFLPTAVAVDSKGNLYVADGGNNRILRYPSPFNQSPGFQPVDLVIGQKTVSSGGSANEGSPTPSQKTLNLNPGSTIYTVAMTFDSTGNLWISDPGNNRVLRFPPGSLNAGTTEPPADLVLGQNDFTTAQLPGTFTNKSKDHLFGPSGLTFDQAGRLYVADSASRVLQYLPPFGTGITASRLLGFPAQLAGQPSTYPTPYSLGNGTQGGSPNGVFTIGNTLFVCDTSQNRIVSYGDPTTWPAESTQVISPPLATVIGQTDFLSGKINHGATASDANSLSGPVSAAVLNNGAEIWVVDTGNNRVIALPALATNQGFSQATRVLGQVDYIYSGSNLVEEKGLFLRSSNLAAGGVVIDANSTPPHLYVADTFNNRILGFKDARSVGTDSRALLTTKPDLVIGQPDFFHSRPNAPGGDPSLQTDTGLYLPIGLVVDKNGNLYVADSGNGRVVRFPAPFSQTTQRANLVLGQQNLFSRNGDPTPNTLNSPWGLALFLDGSLAVSDVQHNRIVAYQKPNGGDFTNGQAAAVVLGQSTFTTTTAAAGNASVNLPRHIATDSSDRLYVADSNNNRMLVFASPLQNGNGAGSIFQLPGLSGPFGVFVSPLTGEIYITNSGSNQILRFPEFQTLQLNGATPSATLSSFGPLTLTLDPFDNLVVLDAANRMTFYFPSLAYRHAATFGQEPMAPGMLADLYLGPVDNSPGTAFKGVADNAATAYPWPTVLSDVQITVNGTMMAPIFKIVSGVVYFQVPSLTPSSGTADFLVSRPSSGQILASGTFSMQRASPGFFTANAAGTGQIAALNHDDNYSVNGPGNGVARTKILEAYLTGQGFISGMPADGNPPTAALSVPDGTTSVLMNPGPASALPASAIAYSGLAFFPGGWQIDVIVPESVPPQPGVTMVVTQYGIASNKGPGGARIVTTFTSK